MNTKSIVLGALVLAGFPGCYGSYTSHEAAVIEQGGDGDGDGDACVAGETDIVAGQHIDAGDITITSDGTDLIFTLTGQDDWNVEEYHIYAGNGPIPVNNAGAAAPGQFPYAGSLDPAADSVTVRVPLAGISAECGDTINVAVHTVMVRIVDGAVVDKQTGWGFGPNRFSRAWGMWFTLEICCDESEGCVRSKGPWREIPAVWPIDELVIGGTLYDAYALVDVLYTGPEDESVDLAHQYIAARLNEASGASVDAQTAADLAAAAALFDANVDADGLLGYGVFADHAAFADFAALRDALWDYNAGLRGTPTCDPEWLAAQPLP